MWQQYVAPGPKMCLVIGAATAMLAFFASSSLVYRWHRRWAADHNRRSAARRTGNPVAVVVATDEAEPAELCQGVVSDRSAGGLGVLAARRVEAGKVVRVRPSTAEGWARLEVRDCSKREGWWQLSCRFVELPPWDVLKGFG